MPEKLPDTSKARKGARDSPAALGYRLPAQWEPHEATWLGWPHNNTDWPGKFAPIPRGYAGIVRRGARGETIPIRAPPNGETHARHVRARARDDPSRVKSSD